MKRILFVIALLCGLASGQASGGGQGVANQYISVNVSQLPAASASNVGLVRRIKDPQSATDCTAGGGAYTTTAVICVSNGTTWVATGGSGGGGTPSNPAQSVQINKAGSFFGDSGLLYDDPTDSLALRGKTGNVTSFPYTTTLNVDYDDSILPEMIAFSGSGLNDMTFSGNASNTGTYFVQITGSGDPDTFSTNVGMGASNIAITGSPQYLGDGLYITFAATTGHTLFDLWTLTVPPRIAANVAPGFHYPLGAFQINNNPNTMTSMGGNVSMRGRYFDSPYGATDSEAALSAVTMQGVELDNNISAANTFPAGTLLLYPPTLDSGTFPEAWTLRVKDSSLGTTGFTAGGAFKVDDGKVQLNGDVNFGTSVAFDHTKGNLSITGIAGVSGTALKAVYDTAITPSMVSFQGGGLNDMTFSGGWPVQGTVEVQISTTGTPDKFRVKAMGVTSDEREITGGPQDISGRLSISFAATTGHTQNNKWILTVPYMYSFKTEGAPFAGWPALYVQNDLLGNSGIATFGTIRGSVYLDYQGRYPNSDIVLTNLLLEGVTLDNWLGVVHTNTTPLRTLYLKPSILTEGGSFPEAWTLDLADSDPATTGITAGGALRTGKGDISLGGKVTTYNALATAGLGIPIIVASPTPLTGQTGDISPTNLVASVAANSTYRFNITLSCESTSAAATILGTLGYTDISNTAQTVASAAAACTALGATSNASLTTTFRAKSGTAITYSTTKVNTPTYTLSVVLEQLTTN